ncbi:ComEC/Rec2 family competence protein [Spirochaetota bacterium]
MKQFREICGKIFVPSLFMLLLLISAILICYSMHTADSSGIILGAFILIVTGLISPIIFKNSMVKRTLVPLLLLSTLILSLTVLSIFSKMKANPLNIETYTLCGFVKRVVHGRYNKEIILKLADNNLRNCMGYNYKNRIYIGADLPGNLKLKRGDIIEFDAVNLKKIDAVKSNSPFTLNLIRRGIHYTLKLYKDDYKVLKNSNGNIKSSIRLWIEKNTRLLFSDKTSSLLLALYFGNKNYIDKGTIINFKRAGVLHVLAASGLHVGIIAIIPFFLLRIIRVKRKIILIITIPILLSYLYITDMPVSLFRACIMFSVYYMQEVFDFDRNIFNALFLTAIIILLVQPYELYSMGFQLSFGATLGIILLFKFYKEALGYLPGFISNSISLSLSAQIIVVPIIVIRIGELNLTGLLSNLVVVPVTVLIMILSILTNFISVASTGFAGMSAILTDYIFMAEEVFVNWISSLGGHFLVNSINVFLFAAYVLALVPVVLYKKRLFSMSIVMAIAICWLSLNFEKGKYDSSLVVFRHKNRRAVLFNDDKHAFLIGEVPSLNSAKYITCYLKKIYVDKLDCFITKPDFDNIRSYSYITKRFIVPRCFLSSGFGFSKYMNSFFWILERDKVKLSIFNSRGKAEKVNFSNIAGYNEIPGEVIFSVYKHIISGKIDIKTDISLKIVINKMPF